VVVESATSLIRSGAVADGPAKAQIVSNPRNGGMIASVAIHVELVLHDDEWRALIAKSPHKVEPPGEWLISERHAVMVVGTFIVRTGRPDKHEDGAGLQEKRVSAVINVLSTEIPDVESA